MIYVCFFFVKQKTAYEMRISDWSSDVCSSDLEKAKPPRPVAILSPTTSHRLGPMPLGPPCVSVWQAVHFLNTSAPCAASAEASRVAIGATASPPSPPSASTPSIG